MGKVCLLHRYRISMAVSDLHLYRGQPQLLEYLVEHGECSQVELSEAMGVSPASVATSIKRLCKAGFVERRADENDRRINRLSITPEGRDALFAGREKCDKIDDTMFDGFTPQETELLLSMLSRMARNLSGGELNEREMMRKII